MSDLSVHESTLVGNSIHLRVTIWTKINNSVGKNCTTFIVVLTYPERDFYSRAWLQGNPLCAYES